MNIVALFKIYAIINDKGMNDMCIEEAIQKLGDDFPHLNWAFVPKTIRESDEVMSYWPGEPDESASCE